MVLCSTGEGGIGDAGSESVEAQGDETSPTFASTPKKFKMHFFKPFQIICYFNHFKS